MRNDPSNSVAGALGVQEPPGQRPQHTARVNWNFYEGVG